MKRRHKTYRRVTVIILAIIIIVFGASEYFLHYALNHSSKNYDSNSSFKAIKADYPWIASWVDSIQSTGALRDSFIINRDGHRLHAWYVASRRPTHNTAVIVHGYKSNSIDMMHIGYMYSHDLGWNILLPDLEAHGQSEGTIINMGWDDRHDVMQWIKVAHGIFNADTMVVHGISMGAATTMCVAGDESRPYVRGYIEDCGYTSVWDEFKGEMMNQFRLPPFPLLHTASMLCKLQYGWSFNEASPLHQVAKSKAPMLFIHGDADTYVPTAMVYPLYKAKPQPKDIWLAEGSEHANSYRDHRQQYTDKTREFINKHVLSRH